MNGYKFRLQKLLDIRIDMEEQSKLKFKEAQIEKENVEIKLSDLENSYEKYKNIDSSKSVVDQKIRLNYLNAVNKSISDTKDELAEKCSNLEMRRKELEKKQIERKTVETLKSKKEMAFYKEQEMIEQRNNDEFALYGFIRRKASN